MGLPLYTKIDMANFLVCLNQKKLVKQLKGHMRIPSWHSKEKKLEIAIKQELRHNPKLATLNNIVKHSSYKTITPLVNRLKHAF